MSRAISTIVFDIGGVLVFNDNNKLLSSLIGDMKEAVGTDDLLAFIRTSGIGVGTTTIAQMHSAASQKFGYRQPLETFLSVWCSHFTPNRPMIELLGTLGSDFDTAICSNTNSAHWDHLDRVYGLGRLVRKAVLSQDCGFEKPDARIFKEVCKQLGVSAQECLFIDDGAENVRAAASFGFHAHQYAGENADADLRDKLKALV